MLLTMNDIPTHWLEILADVENIAETRAVLTGGSLRDLEHEVPHKDLDINIPVMSLDHQEAIIERLEFAWGQKAKRNFAGYVISGVQNEVLGCYTFEDVEGEEVQIIGVSFKDDEYFLKNVVHRNDIGLTQIGTDGNILVRSNAYIKDSLRRTLTICRADNFNDAERSLARLERIGEKYPGFTKVVPPWVPKEEQTFLWPVMNRLATS